MRSKRCMMFSIMTVFTFSLYHSAAIAGGATAKAGLAQAQESAIKWHKDAALVQIIIVSGNMEGTAEKWSFLFHSPQAKMGYKVDVKATKIDQTLEVLLSFTDVVDGDFIDSTQAMTEAKNKGLKGKSRAMMTLHVMLQGTKSEGPYWNIVSDQVEGRSTLIKAETGKFFETPATQVVGVWRQYLSSVNVYSLLKAVVSFCVRAHFWHVGQFCLPGSSVSSYFSD